MSGLARETSEVRTRSPWPWLLAAHALPAVALALVLGTFGLTRAGADAYEVALERRLLDVNGELIVLAFSSSYDWTPAERALAALPEVTAVERFTTDPALLRAQPATRGCS